MGIDRETRAWIAWSRAPGLAGQHMLALHRRFGSLSEAWTARGADVAAACAVKPDVAAGWLAARPATIDVGGALPAGVTALPWTAEGYPAPLRELPDPPGLLFVRGTLPATWDRAVAVVGTRKATDYGERLAYGLGRDLVALGAVVVSGAAAGIDRQAHMGALAVEAPCPTVAVLGGGLDQVYPSRHGPLYREVAARGALVSEYPPEFTPRRWTFPARNRLIAGLSRGVVVVEARARSGSLITADFALEAGRAVMAVPGPAGAPGSTGPHELLRQGARLVDGIADVADELGWEVPTAPAESRTPVGPLGRVVLARLALGPARAEAIAAHLAMGMGPLATVLLDLELAGRVRVLAGQRYVLR